MKTTQDPIHQQIRSRLIERFQHCSLEDRLPSFRQLADEMGVAYLTISGVMKQLEWEGYIKRVPRKGTFLASRERTVQKDHQTGTASRRQTVVFAYPTYFSYATWIRLKLAEELAVKQGMSLVEFKMNPESTYDGLIEMVAHRDDVSGLMMIPVPGTTTRLAVKRLQALGCPVVLLGASDYVSLETNVWSVDVDNYRSGYMLASALTSRGHRRIAYVNHQPHCDETHRDLLRGMKQALVEVGLRHRDLMVVGGDAMAWQDGRAAAEHLTSQLLAEGWATAAIYGSLGGVQGAVKAAREAGATLPDDLSIVSIGRGNRDEDYFNPPITTVDPRPRDEVRHAFDCMFNESRQRSRQVRVEPVLFARQSIAAAMAV